VGASSQSLEDLSTAGLIYMLILGIVLTLWPLATLTNFRGYRDSHARRTLRQADRLRHPFRRSAAPEPSESDRRFSNITQRIVASVFLLAAGSLMLVAVLELVDRAFGT
jgi:hypothetical protein